MHMRRDSWCGIASLRRRRAWCHIGWRDGHVEACTLLKLDLMDQCFELAPLVVDGLDIIDVLLAQAAFQGLACRLVDARARLGVRSIRTLKRVPDGCLQSVHWPPYSSGVAPAHRQTGNDSVTADFFICKPRKPNWATINTGMRPMRDFPVSRPVIRPASGRTSRPKTAWLPDAATIIPILPSLDTGLLIIN